MQMEEILFYVSHNIDDIPSLVMLILIIYLMFYMMNMLYTDLLKLIPNVMMN